MRTTVTLDADAESALRRVMAERGLSFKQALNDAIRAGVAPRGAADVVALPVTRVRSMGVPAIDLDHALRLAVDAEDAELVRRLGLGQ